MNRSPIRHHTFVIERTFAAPPGRVFAAWAEPALKSQWFRGPPNEWTETARELDFRVGGRERMSGVWKDGKMSDFQGSYYDIVPERRIVYGYEMFMDKVKLSVSIGTVELYPAGSGTRLKLTEQGVFFAEHADTSSRERGTRTLLDRLEAALAGRASG